VAREDLIFIKALSASLQEELKMVLQSLAGIRAMLLKHPGPLPFLGSTIAEAFEEFVDRFCWQSKASGRRKDGKKDLG
jgi:hypothetical protein